MESANDNRPQPFVFTDAQRIGHRMLLSPLLWVIAALSLWAALSGYWDAVAVYRNRLPARLETLETVGFRILDVSARTPNFKVQFNDGTVQYLSFPNFLGLNPKGGLHFPEITAQDQQRLVGCAATAKVNDVPLRVFRKKQVWDLDCPAAGIHYGPAIAASQVANASIWTLGSHLLFASLMLFVGLAVIFVDLGVRRQMRRQQGQ